MKTNINLSPVEKGEIIMYQPDVKLSSNGETDPKIASLILELREQQVILDRDLAMLYGVETKALNQAVKRNIERFPISFRFQLSEEEMVGLVTICDRFKKLKHSSSPPYVFTEQGVAMLSAVLRGPTAVRVSIKIMETFVAMRHFLNNHLSLYHRIETLEHNQLLLFNQQSTSSQQLEEVLKHMEAPCSFPKEGIFCDGQIFDAYAFASELIRSAKRRIVLIDNYIDESVLLMLAKRNEHVTAEIVTRHINETLALDIERHNRQYAPITIRESARYHDRFLIIDDSVYHIGASLKDLGKKFFAFSRMELTAHEIGIN